MFDSANEKVLKKCELQSINENTYKIIMPTSEVPTSVLCNIGQLNITTSARVIAKVFKAKFVDQKSTTLYFFA